VYCCQYAMNPVQLLSCVLETNGKRRIQNHAHSTVQHQAYLDTSI
jgi:hypothetical protein